MNILDDLYRQWRGETHAAKVRLAGAGSNRVYYRYTDASGVTTIGVEGTSIDENQAFVYLAGHFAQCGLPVPRVLAVSADGGCYLQTDLGSRSLFDALAGGRGRGGHYDAQEQELLRRTMAELPRLQVLGAQGLDFGRCYPQQEMDQTNVMFDLNYFKYCFLKPVGLDFHEMRLEEAFCQMAGELAGQPSHTFLYRDFQARNVMLDAQGQPWFIDFQGGRRGALEYDVASFLWQASAHYPEELRQELVEVYLDALARYMPVDRALFRSRLQRFVLLRTLQVLGAYGFRGYFERKQHFLDSIQPAMANLAALLQQGACTQPYLCDVLTRLTQLPRFAGRPATQATPVPAGQATPSRYDGQGPLVVGVYSFSYRRGIPADESGNGGGYVFDCRSTHNPGRYEPYKQLTGLDEPVIRFLEDDGEILTFLQSVYRLADAHVERYLQRGFTHLMFSFGCTGGQHRSVYCAQHLAERLNARYGVEVRICHREQQRTQVLPAHPVATPS